MGSEQTAVLVVGGGLVGLSAATFLAFQRVPTVLVERHAGSSIHPRAIGFTPRSVELFRSVGLRDRVPQVQPGLQLRRVRADSLAGKWHEEQAPWTPEDASIPALERSPCRGAALTQDKLEPILRERALELGADLRLGTQLLGFSQDASGVRAQLQAPDGRSYELQAQYMIGADGHRSPVREALGIGREGRGFMRTVRSVIFRAPLDEYLRAGIGQFVIEEPDFSGFLTTYADGRWLLMFHDDQERDEASLLQGIRRAIGQSDLPIEIVATGRWHVSALIANRFASGRVFLAGDAAHTLPPNRGGYGANTGIEDAHNLAWKLHAVTSGVSTPALLDSYEAERKPIAWLRHDQIFARADFKPFAGTSTQAIIDDAAMELGQLYRSSAVLGAGPELPPAQRPEQWCGQPGTRAPHVWLRDGRSTLDWFGRGWVLLTAAAAWQPAAAALGLTCQMIEAEVRDALGLTAGGASLIRPDGYIAWRAQELPEDPTAALLAAVSCVAST